MLTQVNPLHLSRLWHLVKPGLEEVLEDLNKNCLQELWVPEDIYSSIKTGESFLWMSDEGFVVTQVQQDKYTGIKKLFVWIGYSYDPTNNVLIDNQLQLEQIAKYFGCELMGFNSIRIGFQKKAKELGYSSGITTYTKRI